MEKLIDLKGLTLDEAIELSRNIVEIISTNTNCLSAVKERLKNQCGGCLEIIPDPKPRKVTIRYTR